jgi:quinol monooxygenase YgiN
MTMSNRIIQCVADVFVKLESVEKVRSVLIKLVEDARNDEGCLKFKLFENINDNSQFTFIEVWENEEAFEDHLQSDLVRIASMDINNDLTKPADVKRYKCIPPNPSKTSDTRTSGFCILL